MTDGDLAVRVCQERKENEGDNAKAAGCKIRGELETWTQGGEGANDFDRNESCLRLVPAAQTAS